MLFKNILSGRVRVFKLLFIGSLCLTSVLMLSGFSPPSAYGKAICRKTVINVENPSFLSHGEGSCGVEDELLGELETALPEGAEHLASAEGIKDFLTAESIKEILTTALSGKSYLKELLSAILAIGLLLVLGEKLGGEMAKPIFAVLCWVGSVELFRLSRVVVVEVAQGISGVSRLFSGLAPIMTAALVAGGGTATAGAISSGINFALWIMSALGEPVLLSLCVSMALLGAIGAYSGPVASLASGLKTAFFRVLGIFSAILSGVVALQSYVCSVGDGVAMRAAKHAAAGLIPIVGQGVSGALGVLLGGVSYSSGIIGGAAVGGVVSVALAPAVVALGIRLCFSLAAFVLDFCHAPWARSLFQAFLGAIDALLAIYIMSITVCILHVVLFMKGGAQIVA